MAPSRPALKAGRPPTARQKTASLSKQATSSTIRRYHQLNKSLAAATAKGESGAVEKLRKQIADLGGLESYQKASFQGQANDRGGDSSIVLMEWLREYDVNTLGLRGEKLRLLEVGALSTKNVCSTSGLFEMTRIDLNSQGDGILQQDFMERPLPGSDDERFDVISLSLVLNFVPSPAGRGEMLERTCRFLRHTVDSPGILPALFLVLPAACTMNSRFMDEDLLTEIMGSLGYSIKQRRVTSKLVYYLWTLQADYRPQTFTKKEVNPGRSRNNFSIVLEKT